MLSLSNFIYPLLKLLIIGCCWELETFKRGKKKSRVPRYLLLFQVHKNILINLRLSVAEFMENKKSLIIF